MPLLPALDGPAIGRDVEIIQPAGQTSRTYKLDVEAGRIYGFVDGAEAMKQAIWKILLTERFTHLIYSWNYGIELNNIIGESFQVLSSEIKRVVREALLADGRITEVSGFTVERAGRRAALISFTAGTVFGGIPVERVVGIDV